MTTPASPLLTSSSPTGISLSPEDRAAIIIGPLLRDSVALTAATLLRTGRDSISVPLLTADPTSAFVAEGEEISADDPTVSEVPIRPVKVAGLSVLSRELAEDSDPAAADLVGESLARSVRKTLDVAFLSDVDTSPSGSPAPIEPLGVLGWDGIVTDLDPISVNLDPLVAAIATIEDADGTADTIIMRPQTWAYISTMKSGIEVQVPLINPTAPASAAASRQLFGIPVTVTPHAPADAVAVWDRQAIVSVLREDVSLAIDTSRYFEYDSVGVRTTLRASWAVVCPGRVVRLDVAPWPTSPSGAG